MTILLLLFLAAWPRFRGPNGSGVSDATTVPVQWTTNDYNWVVTLPGIGHSSPVIVGQRLFVTSGDDKTAARIVLCLNAATGKTIWQHDLTSAPFRQNKDNSYASASPAADADGVVVAWSTPGEVMLAALDNSGRELWRRNLGPFVGIHGSGNSPILVDDLVVFNNDQEDPASLPPFVYAAPGAPKTAGKSFVIALDRRTGKTRWQLDRRSNQSAYITPCVRRTADGRNEIILASTAHGITGVDAATGKVNWELSDLFKDRCIASPVLAGDLVIAGEGRGASGTRFVAVKPGATPRVAFEVQKPVPIVPTPLVKDDRLFLWGDSGTVLCVRATTGELIWSDRVQGAFYSSPVWVNGRLYNVGKNGDVFVLGAGDKFELLAKIPLGEKCYATPAVANGMLYLHTYSHLFAIGGKR